MATPSELLFDEVVEVSATVLAAQRVMFYAHHEWPGWGDEAIAKTIAALNDGPALADRLHQFAIDHRRAL